MKKRLLALLLAVSVSSTLLVGGVQAATSDLYVTQTVQALGIMEGDGSGTINWSEVVTRAQFTKMLLTVSPEKDMITSVGTGYSLYSDVKSDHWASAYIKLAVEAGYMTGYTDGSYRPDESVTLEQACNAILKMLGYSTSSLTGAYPTAQINKAREIGLLDDVTASQGETLTRTQCAQLFYNLMEVEVSSGVYYGTSVDCPISDGEVDYLALIESTLEGPYVYQSGTALSFTPLTTYYNGLLSTTATLQTQDVYYYNEYLQSLWIYRETATGTLTARSPSSTSPTSVTVGGEVYTLEGSTASYQASSLQGVDLGDTVTLLLGLDDVVVAVETNEHDGIMDYDLLTTANLSGPYVWDGGDMEYSFTPVFVYDNNVLSSASALTVGDVYYYNELAKTVWIHSETDSGTITALTGTSVTVDSTVYAFETTKASYKLSTLGGASVGDAVTLTLGVDGVVDVTFYDSQSDMNYTLLTQANLSDAYVYDGVSTKFTFTPTTVYDNSTLSTISALSTGDVYYYNEAAKTVWIYTDTETGTITNLTSSSVTINSTTYVFESDTATYKLSALAGAEVGDSVTLALGITGVVDVTFYDTQDELDYALLTQDYLSDPYVCDGTLPQLSFTPNAVYDNGTLSSLSALALYDVYYYNETTKTVWIYTDTASGTISARSSGIAPTSVTVGGVTYAISTDEASYKLSALNGTDIGDTVTLILGMDDTVVGVKDSSVTSGIYYGIIQNIVQEPSIYSGSTIQTVVDVGCTDGNSYQFIIDGEVSYSEGSIVSIQMTSSGTSISKLTTKSISGTVNKYGTKLGSYTFAEDVNIIDTDDSGAIVSIDADRLANAVISTSDVDYYVLNSAGEISHLILDEVTGDTFSYGYMSSASSSSGSSSNSLSISSSYTYILDGVEKSLNLSNKSYDVSVGGVMFIYDEDGALESISQLSSVTLDQVTSTTAVADQQEYTVSDDVDVYLYVDGSYQLVNLDDVDDISVYRLTAWYDDLSFSAGGQIRVITARIR